jgi:HEAT repeat protein
MLSSWWDSLRFKSSNPVLASWWGNLRLRSSDPAIRSKALEHLSTSKLSRDTERVFASLKDESPNVRCAAVRALEKKSDRPEALKSLVRALGDPAPEVRETAVLVLSRSGNPKVTGALAGSLKDAEPSVRRAAAGGLRALGWRPSTQEEAARFDIALGNTSDVFTAPTPKIDYSPETNTAFHRRIRAEAEKEKNDPARISALFAAANGSDLLGRLGAIHDLGQATSPVVSAELLKFLSDREKEIRLTAAQALSGRADTQPADLLGLLEDPSSEVRLVAVRFFARVPNRQITHVLLPLLSDSAVEVRQATATAVGFEDNLAAIEELVLSLMDEDSHVRHTAHEALHRIDPNWLTSNGARAARPRLESMLTTCNPSDLERLHQLLASIAPGESGGPDSFLSATPADFGYQS